MENSVATRGENEALDIVLDVRRREVAQLLDRHGEAVVASASTKLMPVAELEIIIGGLGVAGKPCGMDVAKKLATFLVSQYRASDFICVKSAITGIAMILEDHPKVIADAAVKAAMRRKFRPNTGDVEECIQSERRARFEKCHAAYSQIKEHRRRKKEREEVEKYKAKLNNNGERMITHEMYEWRKSTGFSVDGFAVSS